MKTRVSLETLECAEMYHDVLVVPLCVWWLIGLHPKRKNAKLKTARNYREIALILFESSPTPRKHHTDYTGSLDSEGSANKAHLSLDAFLFSFFSLRVWVSLDIF